ncbi:MAG TPA: TolC family protein, partial [Bacteroidia bacterium]|nr:TolC family protein [Bacteroidia bacterium]
MKYNHLNIKLLFLLLDFFVYSGGINAQTMSLDSIINIIKINNLELKIYDEQIKAYNEYAKGAKSLDPPQVGAGFFMTPYDPKMWMPDAMNNNAMGSYMFSAQQMFMNPQKLNANSTYMKSMSAVDSAMQKSMKNELISMAKMNYYEWMFMKKKLVVLSESEELLNYLIKATELRYTYGMDKLNSYYKAKAMLGEIQTMKVMVEQDIQQKIISLNTLMNRDKNKLFDIDTSYALKNYELDATDSSSIVKNRSDYSILSKNINALKTKQNYEYSKRFPDFGIKYDHMIAFGNEPQQFSIMAMVTIPIVPWSSKMYKSTVAGLNFEIEAEKVKQKSFVNQVSGNIENIKVQIKGKKQQVALSEKIIIPSVDKNYQTELLAYEQNTEMLFMVLDAWQNL